MEESAAAEREKRKKVETLRVRPKSVTLFIEDWASSAELRSENRMKTNADFSFGFTFCLFSPSSSVRSNHQQMMNDE